MLEPISLLILILSLSVHEFAHALVADKLGDPTPRHQGRLTLNPLAHIDPLGLLSLILVRFGWGKPVQIDPYNLQNPRRDELLISLAGPVSNLFLAIIISLLSKIFSFYPEIILLTIFLNVSLAIFNLVPIYPLDGSKIFLNLLPPNSRPSWESALHHYGQYLLLLLVLPLFGQGSLIINLIRPIVTFITSLLLSF